MNANDSSSAAWEPVILRAGNDADRSKLSALSAVTGVVVAPDTIIDQIGELLETRSPGLVLSPADRPAAVRAYAGTETLEHFGVWVYFPWRRAITHLLPEADFRELRTSRNRNKISAEEQNTLRSLTVSIAGLSVGRATALTLALEEIGGTFHLADFDHLELSNLNRLRGSVLELGVNKAVLTAREMFEINPFLEIRIFPEGVSDDNLDAFLGTDRPVDVLFDECDDLKMKFVLREAARRRRIPVLMETSDRGMLDVERFDLEPERPFFHGLVGDHDAKSLGNLSTYDKVPIVLELLGAREMSSRLTASMLDIDTSLKTWPQLASAVALGGALNATAARLLALGELTRSGRFYVDIDADLRAEPRPRSPRVGEHWEVMEPDLPLLPDASAPELERIRALVAHAALAPSGGNMQPWRFELDGRRLACFVDTQRGETRSILDFRSRASLLACGASALNIELVAPALGFRPTISLSDAFDPSAPVFIAELEPAPPHPDPVSLDAVRTRCTNRKLGPRVPLATEAKRALLEVATAHDAELSLVTEAEGIERLADVIAHSDRIRYLDPAMRGELFSELRLTRREALTERDGIDLPSLELDPTQRAGIDLLQRADVMDTLRHIGAGHGLGRGSRKALASAAAIGILRVSAHTENPYLRGGRAMQGVWLRATTLGLAFQPLTAFIYMLQRLREDPNSLSPWARERLAVLATAYAATHPEAGPGSELMVFRLAVAQSTQNRSPRRPLDAFFDVLRGPTL